jgi:prophage maintenance system killer protein
LSNQKLRDLEIILKQLFIESNQEYKHLSTTQKAKLQSILDGTLQTAFGEELYPTLCDKATHILNQINHQHILEDGNKRLSLVAFEFTLRVNGTTISDNITQKTKEHFILSIASSIINKQKSIDCCIKAIKNN